MLKTWTFRKYMFWIFLAHFTTHIHNVRTDITAQRGFEWTFWMCFQISSKYISILCACPSRRWLRRLRSSDWQSRRQQPFLGLFSRFSTLVDIHTNLNFQKTYVSAHFVTFSAHFRRFFAEIFSYKVKPVIHRLFSPKNSRYYILYDEYIYILKVYRQTVSMSPNMLKNLL